MDAATSVSVGQTRVDFSALTIEGPHGKASIEPKVMDLLQVLAERSGEVVSRSELIDQIWNDHPGGDESLSRAISLLRKALGQADRSQQYIATVPKRGYRMLADVLPSEQAADPAPPRDTEPGQATPVSPPARRGWLAAAFGLVLAAALAVALYPGDADRARQDPQLASISAAPSQGEAASVAVLPFADLSIEGNQQYLADGLAEEILNALVRFQDLRVIGRQSSFAFRGSSSDPGEVGSRLAVSHVLTGSVRKQQSRVRITISLAQAADGSTVWSERYDGDLDDIFDLQEDIARQVASRLGVVLDLAGQQRFAPRLTQNREAYELFLHGRTLARKFGNHNKEKAEQLLRRAIDLDPNFAAAWAWLAQAHIYQTLAEPELMSMHVMEARKAVQRGLNLDPDLAIGHYVMGILHAYDLDIASAVDAVEKAWQLSPNQPLIAIRRGYYRTILGQSGKGADLMAQGLRWDPTDAIGLLNLGIARQATGDLDGAATLLKRSHDLGFQPAAAQLCVIQSLRPQAQAAARCWRELPPEVRARYGRVFDKPDYWPLVADAQFLGDESAMRVVNARLDDYLENPNAQMNSYLMRLLPPLGDPARFMRAYLEHPFPLNTGIIASIWDDDPANRRLRQHPGFPAFAERTGLLRAWRKYGWPDRCRETAGASGSDSPFSCD